MKPILNIVIPKDNINLINKVEDNINNIKDLLSDYHVIISPNDVDFIANNMIKLSIDHTSQLEEIVKLLRSFPTTVTEYLNSGYEDINNIPLNPSDEYIHQMINDINLTPNEIDDEYILELIKTSNIDPMLITEVKFDIKKKVPWTLLDNYIIKMCNGEREKILIEAAMRRNGTRDLKNHKGRRIW